jgi:hypothetical protein
MGTNNLIQKKYNLINLCSMFLPTLLILFFTCIQLYATMVTVKANIH